MAPANAAQEAAVWIVERTSNEEELKSDERLVRDWVKNELWEKVVFLWTLKSLNQGGLLHASYISSCRHLLAKGKLMSMPDVSAINYMNILWDRMTKARSYNAWLGQKRSNTLQALQDRFYSKFITQHALDYHIRLTPPTAHAELCEDCQDSDTVLPSLESFNKRMLQPKVHFVFYNYFLRGVIGEKTWKLRIEDESKELATIAAEAYANLQLNNNYFAWLYEYMYAHPTSSLTTEYDAVEQAENEEEGDGLENVQEPKQLFSADLDLLEITVPASYAAANASDDGTSAQQAPSDASEENEEQPREDFKLLLPINGDDEEPSAEIRAARDHQQNVTNSIKERIDADRTGNGDGSTRLSAYMKMRHDLDKDRRAARQAMTMAHRKAAKKQSRKSKKNLRDFTQGPRKSKKGSDEILGWSVQGKLYMQKLMEKIQREGRGRGTGENRRTADSGLRRKWESMYRQIIKFSAPSTGNQGEGDGEDFEMDETVMYAGIVSVAV